MPATSSNAVLAVAVVSAGACATVYRYDGQVKIEVGLSCQTVIEPNMYIAQLPFFPAKRTPYNLDDFKEQCFEKIKEAYPEVFKCMGCNTCTKSLPHGNQRYEVHIVHHQR